MWQKNTTSKSRRHKALALSCFAFVFILKEWFGIVWNGFQYSLSYNHLLTLGKQILFLGFSFRVPSFCLGKKIGTYDWVQYWTPVISASGRQTQVLAPSPGGQATQGANQAEYKIQGSDGSALFRVLSDNNKRQMKQLCKVKFIMQPIPV